jgi:hypothetical protein
MLAHKTQQKRFQGLKKQREKKHPFLKEKLLYCVESLDLTSMLPFFRQKDGLGSDFCGKDPSILSRNEKSSEKIHLF